MTNEEIRTLAKQAGGLPYAGLPETIWFDMTELYGFVRLVRESVLEEAACKVEAMQATSAAWCAEKVRSLKT